MKRFLYILLVIASSLLLVGTMCVCALRSDKVEHAAIRLVTDELSRGLGTHARVGDIEYCFPARIRIHDIYIEDQQGDTLLYVGEVYAHFRLLPLLDNEIRFSRVEISRIRADIHRLPNQRYNYAFLLDAFASSGVVPEFHSLLSLRDVRIEQLSARYDDYQADIDHAYMELYHLTADSLDAEVRSLTAKVVRTSPEGTIPLYVQELQARLVYNDTLLAMPRLYVRLPRSEMEMSGVHILDAGTTDEDAPPIISLHVRTADVCPNDLILLIPQLGHIDRHLRFTADIGGNMDSIEATNLSLFYDDQRLFLGDFALLGLLSMDNPHLRMHCQDLYANAGIVQDFLSDYLNRPYRLPNEIHRLGDVHYKGQIDGRLHDMSLHGAFRTALGVITTEGRLRSDSLFENMDYDVRVATERFRLGTLLAHRPLGPISLDIHSSGKVMNGQPDGRLSAHVRNLTYNDYTYREILADGQFRHKRFNGMVSIRDENLELYFKGLVNLSKAPNVNFDVRLERFRPGVLQLSSKLADVEIGCSLAANLSGKNVDDMNGYVVIDSLRLRNGADSVLTQQLKLLVQSGENYSKQILFTGDYATAGVNGHFRYADLPNALLRQAMRYVPSAFSEKLQRRIAKSKANDTHIDFYLYGHRLRALQRVLQLPVRLYDQPVIKGFLYEEDNVFGLRAYAPGLKIGTAPIHDITLSLDNNDNRFSLSLSAEALNMGGVLRAAAANDSLHLSLALHQTDSAPHTYGGDIHIHTRFLQYAGLPLINIHVLPSDFRLRDSLYTLSDSRIDYCVADTMLSVLHFGVEASHQYIKAMGVASPRMTDSLRVELGNIDAGFVLPFVLPEKSFKLGGSLTGWATLYGLFSKPFFEADLRLDSAQINDMYVGNAVASVALDQTTKEVLINGDVVQNNKHLAHVDGTVDTQSKDNEWGLMIYPDSVPLNFINHWTNGIISDISGYGSGVVHIFGKKPNGVPLTWVTAKVKADGAALTIPYTGCRYYLTDSIFMDSAAIRFSGIDLYDAEGHRLHLDGSLCHTNFKDFTYSFDVNVYDAMALNLPDKAGEMLQGKVYANGDVQIRGDEKEVRIAANARTVGKSRFRFSIDYASTAAENSFITFVDHHTPPPALSINDEDEDSLPEKEATRSLTTRVLLAMNIDVNQQLLAQVMLGERTGDMIQARGDGALRFTYDSQNEDIKLMGNYEIAQGSLDFTVGNIIRRQFTISDGGSILWAGSPEHPQVNVTAKYRVTASLKDLFGTEIDQLATTRTSVPVNTCLTMSGDLMQPTFRFAIELPLSDESVQSQVQSIINTDEMLMRQVIYLLVFGRFFTPEYMSNSQFATLNDTYSLLSSTITGQINAWLSRLTNVFSMGVNIRTDGEGADASQEYEAQFQLQPVDRLVINGNVGYRYNDLSNQPFFGDLDVEVMLTEDGKLRLKGYTHTVDKYSLRQANTIQGVGFVWKHDFNWPTKDDLQRRKANRKQQPDNP